MLGLNLGRAWLGLLALLISVPVLATAVDDALLTDGWSEVTFDGKTPNHFTANPAGGVIVESNRSVSLIERPLDIDLAATPRLSWRWRVDAQAPATDLRIKGEDDRSIGLYVAFPFVPEEASLFERMKRGVIESVAGEDAPGRVLMYVWGGKGERGDRVVSPYTGSAGMIIILRPAGTDADAWFDETVDIAEDYRRTFGDEPPNPISIAIGADTDDTATMARGVITDLAFQAAPALN